MKYFIIATLLLAFSGCTVYEKDWNKCSDLCKNNNGISYFSKEIPNDICVCKNEAQFYLN